MTALIAIGGNSLIRAGEKGAICEQLANARRTAAAIADIIRHDYRLVITHGNGPQVGAALFRSERASDLVYAQPLDVCDAATQGEIGYILAQSLRNELEKAGVAVPVVTVLTQTLVSPGDPAMRHPTKPIGPFYSRAGAEERKRLWGWDMVEDAARGYRRVVPSPEPIGIVELDVIRALMNEGMLVVACGGGGIPVICSHGALVGVEAVVDKDRVSAFLATELGLDRFVICTDTDFAYLDYKKPSQRPLTRISTAEIEAHYRAGQFAPGNMGPKIEAALRFLRNGGKEVIITSREHLSEAVTGPFGTHILPADDADTRPCEDEHAVAV